MENPLNKLSFATGDLIGKIISVQLVRLVRLLLASLIVMLLSNYFMSLTIGLSVNFWEAVGLYILCQLLFTSRSKLTFNDLA